MSPFRAGKYHRHKLGILKHFAPMQAVHALVDITPEELIAAGKKLVLVDVDNTLVEWRSEEIPETTVTWLEFMKRGGLQVCILSNTRNVNRLKGLSERLGIPYRLGKFKPSRAMYRMALEEFNTRPEEAIMIGDQLFTDILGANRSGIDAIWVKQMSPRDFVGTKISRFGERLIRGRLHSVLVDEDSAEIENPQTTSESAVEEDLPVGGTAAFELLASPIVRQFVKFCIVGGSSTVIDVGIFWLLRFYVPWGNDLLSHVFGHFLVSNFPSLFQPLVSHEQADATVPVFKIFSSTIAIFNAFIWNRRWTFKIRGKEHRSVQLRKFFVVAVIGMILNAIITTGLNSIIPGHPKRSLAIATAIATVIVAIWNFSGQKYWTFKQKH